jgi:hypothetical protein
MTRVEVWANVQIDDLGQMNDGPDTAHLRNPFTYTFHEHTSPLHKHITAEHTPGVEESLLNGAKNAKLQLV